MFMLQISDIGSLCIIFIIF